MTKRFQKLVLTVSALAALALGGAVFAQAQTSQPTKTPAVATDAGNLQVGDQTTPDTGTPTPETGAASETTGASETTTETTSESATPNDGPGGHADAPGANVDHQFQGNE
jgi:hypothetical protein